MFFVHAVKSYKWATCFSSPLKEGVLWIFITLKSLIYLAKFKTANLGSSGKYTNYYTTKATKLDISSLYLESL
jgi:hypothetical protein